LHAEELHDVLEGEVSSVNTMKSEEAEDDEEGWLTQQRENQT
jgi:hypothetical protein